MICVSGGGGCLLSGSCVIEVFCQQEQNTDQAISEYVRFPIAMCACCSTCYTDVL